VLLSALYRSLETTPWVSMPHLSGDFGTCITGQTYHEACKMLNAVVSATKKDQAGRQVRQHLADGTVALQADVTLQTFLDSQIVVASRAVIDRMTDKIRQQPIHSTITISPQGTFQQIEMVAKFPTPADIPRAPDASQVTVLPDQAASTTSMPAKTRLGAMSCGNDGTANTVSEL
jgi:hypothetical protein